MNLHPLTQTVQKGGCAAKISALELRKILSQVKMPPINDRILVDGSLFDDAAVFQINSDLALVQTLDFFTPIVDTPYIFGQVAAANALSDIYSMGGEPISALGILAFPLTTLPENIAVEILQGASDVLSQAGTPLVGGHSIDDDTLKFGLSVNGFVHPQRIWTNQGAQANDLLILTKPLGTGTIMAGLKRKACTETEIQEVLNAMTNINRIGDLITNELAASIHAATDITGFGLLGHALQMAKASHKRIYFHFNKIPVFVQAWDSLKNGFLTKAHKSNANYTVEHTQFNRDQHLILFDPQTSGGLLLSVKADSAHEILNKIRQRFFSAEIIGHVSSLDQEDQSPKYLYLD